MPSVIPEQFRDAEFLSGRRSQQSHPDRLKLFTPHLAAGEAVRAVMPLKNSVLLLTDRRILELEPHLEAHGAWNVMGFQGFDLRAELPLSEYAAMEERDTPDAPGTKGRLELTFRGRDRSLTALTEVAGEPTRAAIDRLRTLLHPK